jgi:hypothetical protein
MLRRVVWYKLADASEVLAVSHLKRGSVSTRLHAQHSRRQLYSEISVFDIMPNKIGSGAHPVSHSAGTKVSPPVGKAAGTSSCIFCRD